MPDLLADAQRRLRPRGRPKSARPAEPAPEPVEPPQPAEDTPTTKRPGPAPAADPLLVDYSGAARLFSVSEDVIRDLVREGRLAVIRVRRCVRFATSDLRALVNALREPR